MIRFLKKIFGRSAATPEVIANNLGDGDEGRLSILIISAGKKNQNYYRDLELAKSARSLFVSETFDWGRWNYSVADMAQSYFAGRGPDLIFINYNHQYSHLLRDLDRLGVPVIGFVGDHYDFLDDSPRARTKKAFFRGLQQLAAMVSAYPHTNASVAEALGRPDLPFLYLPWAVDPAVFCDLGKRRPYDIACIGALTEGKYPLRRLVREWIETKSGLRYVRKKRFGGHDGEQFNRALNTTYSAFTCASAYRYTLMKFFEIPASGALLFAETTPEFSALGFRDGEHYVAVDASNFADRIRHYTSKEGRPDGERIRAAGYAYVRENHSWAKRIPPFLKEIERLL